MKTKISVFLITFSLLVSSAWAETRQVNILVKGMVCSFCAQGIKKKFQSETAVQAVDVSLGEKKVKLTLKENQTISDEKITKLLTESGYNVEKIDR